MNTVRLFDELSENRGLPRFEFDGDGVCVLSTDEGVLHIQCREELNDIMLTVTLGHVEDARTRGRVCERLMVANYAQDATAGGVFALNEGLQEFVYQYIVREDGLTAEHLGTILDNFFQVVEIWQPQVSQLIANAMNETDAEEGNDVNGLQRPTDVVQV